MANDIHTTSAGEQDGPSPWYESRAYKSCVAALAVLRWIIVAVVFAFGVYVYQRDVNAQQTVSVVDIRRDLDEVKLQAANNAVARDRQIERLVTTERFEERTANISQRLDRIEARQEEILMRLTPRP